MKNSIVNEVKSIVAAYLPDAGLLQGHEIEELSLSDQLSIDSLDLTEIIVDLEEHFGIEFDEAEVEEVKTIRDIAGILESKVAGP